MGYKYEMHLHTSLGSACGKSHGQEYIDYFKSLGYDGIFVTDHFWRGNTAVDRSLPWEEWVDGYCAGYEELKKLGDEQGLKVFFGWETSYEGDDFIYYGLGKDWLKAHPQILQWDHKQCYEAVKRDGGYVVQAHPFRERIYIRCINLHPEHTQCDAWEVANACNEPYQDMLAYRYAKKHGKKMTCGSDMHLVGFTDAGKPFAMVTEEPIMEATDYGKIVESGKYTMEIVEERLDTPFRLTMRPVEIYDENNQASDYDVNELADVEV